MKTENGFRDEYSFLSNFTKFEMPMIYDRLTFTSNEHFYQAMKFKDREIRIKISKHESKGLKSYTKNFQLRHDWNDIKISVMRYGLSYKFSDHNPKLKAKLLSTIGTELVEYNYWGDKFWGVCIKTGIGENKLGKLLMQIREELSNE